MCVCVHMQACQLLLIHMHLGRHVQILSVCVCVPACVEIVKSRPPGTRCHREKQLRERETAASSGVYQRWSLSNSGDIFPNTGLLLSNVPSKSCVSTPCRPNACVRLG